MYIYKRVYRGSTIATLSSLVLSMEGTYLSQCIRGVYRLIRKVLVITCSLRDWRPESVKGHLVVV